MDGCCDKQQLWRLSGVAQRNEAEGLREAQEGGEGRYRPRDWDWVTKLDKRELSPRFSVLIGILSFLIDNFRGQNGWAKGGSKVAYA